MADVDSPLLNLKGHEVKAAWYDRVGNASEVIQVGTQPDPSPGPSDVLVSLRSSGVNPSDVKARAGTRGGSSQLAYPRVIPHSDGAGVVVGTGANVRGIAVGDRVWVSNGQWQRADGTAAELIAIHESLVFPLPDGVSFEVGAALGIPAVTASHATLGFGPLTGKTVLVSGGAGTVGRLAVQLASGAGARVIATGHGEKERERAMSGGAHAFLDFADRELAQQVLAANGGRLIDHIVEVEYGANAQMTADVIAPRGILVTYGSAKVLRPDLPFYTLLFKGVRMEFMLVYLLTASERTAAAERVNAMLGSGTLDVPIHAVYSMEECALAHEAGQRAGAVIVSC